MTTSSSLQRGHLNAALTPRWLVGRRGALQRIGACILGLASGLRVAFPQKRLALGLDKVEKLKSPGGSALLKIQGRDLLFIRESEDMVRVLDPTCTHKKCTVEYNMERKRIICPCHSSNFSLDGKVLNGPAEKPLQAFEANLDPEKTRIIFSLE